MTDRRVRRHPLGFLEAVNKPDPETLRLYYAKQYFQGEQGNYRTEYSGPERSYIESKTYQRYEMIREIFPELFRGRRRFLDVGCGEGFAMAFFRNHGWQISGLDYSGAGLNKMNPDCQDALETGDLFALLDRKIEAGDKYDLVMLTNVLEHVTDPPGLLRRLHRLVDHSGALILTVPNDFSNLQCHLLGQGYIDRAFWVALPDHLAYFDRESLEAITLATGWINKAMLADFPVDWYLVNVRSNYVTHPEFGKDAHKAKLELENLLTKQPIHLVNRFYSAMADVGMGRNITAFLLPRDGAEK